MDEHVAFLKDLFADRLEFEDGVHRLLSYCCSVEPRAKWGELESLDFREDAAGFAAWACRNLPGRPEQGSIRAFHIGISEDGGSIQMDGASDYDEADIQCQWLSSSVYRSTEDWNDSAVLEKIQIISEESDGSVPNLLYLLCLGYVGLLAQHWAPRALWEAFDSRAPVAVGFLDEDSYVVLPDSVHRDLSTPGDEATKC